MSHAAPSHARILVLGAGPTGIGAAIRLEQLGCPWLLLELRDRPGGLASTSETPEGFLFDRGGHVMFSHYQDFDDVLDAALGADAWLHHRRVAHVWLRSRLVPYPFQLHLDHLDAEDALRCKAGLEAARARRGAGTPASFADWIDATFGEGVGELFMRPYNLKVWGTPLEEMQCEWVGERVAVPDRGAEAEAASAPPARDGLPAAGGPDATCPSPASHAAPSARCGAARAGSGATAAAWGPNASFRFPLRGGTGAVWEAVARRHLPPDRVRYGQRVVAIDPDARAVRLASGATVTYERLVSTLPLTETMRLAGRPALAAPLRRTHTHVVGLGLRGRTHLGDTCWMYFPDSDVPFYRATVFSNYSPHNVPPPTASLPTLCAPEGLCGLGAGEAEEPTPATGKVEAAGGTGATAATTGPYWSLMFEVTETELRPLPRGDCCIAGRVYPRIVGDVIRSAAACGLIRGDAEVVSAHHQRLEHGYPVPTLGRDAAVARCLEWLAEREIHSRGRFGAWKYEVSNQDHSLMQGLELVDFLVCGVPEDTIVRPGSINGAGKRPARRVVAPRDDWRSPTGHP